MKNEFIEDQEVILKMNPNLRFKCGDVVFWKTDRARKNPMVIKKLLGYHWTEDYMVCWFDSQKSLQTDYMFDVALIPDDRSQI
jgi:hypothetical protein